MRHQPWMSTAAYYVGLLGLAAFVLQGDYSWLPYILGTYLLASLTVTVGYHRLFCHAAFKTPRAVHWFFSITGVMFMYSSSLQWIVTHFAHHKHSDTDLDPHLPASKAMLFKSYRDVPLDLWKSRLLLRDGGLHRFMDSNYMLVFMTIFTALAVWFPQVLLNVYLPALGLAHLVGAFHNTVAHWGGKPRDLWFFEYIIPTSGEWFHKTHHEQPRLAKFGSRWYHLDLGALAIWCIKSR